MKSTDTKYQPELRKNEGNRKPCGTEQLAVHPFNHFTQGIDLQSDDSLEKNLEEKQRVMIVVKEEKNPESPIEIKAKVKD